MKHPWDDQPEHIRKRWQYSYDHDAAIHAKAAAEPLGTHYFQFWQCVKCNLVERETRMKVLPDGLHCPSCTSQELYKCWSLESDPSKLAVGVRVILRYSPRRKPYMAIRRGSVQSIDYSDPGRSPIRVLCDYEKGKPSVESMFGQSFVLESEYDALHKKGILWP